MNSKPRTKKGYVLPPGIYEPRNPIAKLRFLVDPYTNIDNASKLGDIAVMSTSPLFSYAVFHPELVRAVLEDRTNVRGPGAHSIIQLIGVTLLTADGDKWPEMRPVVEPMFHEKLIIELATTMAQVADRMQAGLADGVTIDMKVAMEATVLRLITRSFLGDDIEDDGIFIDAVNAASQNLRNRATIPPLLSALMYALPLPATRRMKRHLRHFNQVMEDHIARISQDAGKTGMLSTLLGGRNPDTGYRLTAQELRSEVFSSMLTGHHILAVALMWIWHSMATWEKAANTVYAEIDRVLGDRVPSLDDLPKLTATRQFVLESLRLSPSFYMNVRATTRQIELGGYDIPKGAFIFNGFMWIQRDPRWWDDPEEFKLERWVPGFRESLPPYTYLAFMRDAPMGCPAEHFDMMAMTMFVATIGRRWRFRLQEEPTMHCNFNRSVAGTMQMTPERRA